MSSRWSILSLVLMAGTACHVNKAPADINGQQTWFWDNYVAGTDADVAAAVVTLNGTSTVRSVDSSNAFTGTLSVHLAPSDLDIVSLKGINDPSTAQGLIAITEMPCTLDQIEPLLYRTDQDKLHSGSYLSYSRTYNSSLDDYKSRKNTTITWQSTMSVSDVGAKYTDTVRGGLRRVPALDKTQSPFGPILLARTWLPKPATNTNSGSTFKQDYQMEVYYERTPGHTVHVFSDWRDIDLATSIGEFTMTNTTDQQIVLSNDVTWDQDTAKECGSSG